MIKIAAGAWLPSQRAHSGMLFADQSMTEAISDEIALAREEAVAQFVAALSHSIVETEVGACVAWREVLRLSQPS